MTREQWLMMAAAAAADDYRTPEITPYSLFGSRVINWVRSDYGIITSSGAVSDWRDSAPIASPSHYVQGTQANRPPYTSSGGPNGRAFLQIADSSDALATAGFTLPNPATTATTIWAIARQDANTAGRRVLTNNGAGSNTLTLEQVGTTLIRLNNGATGGSVGMTIGSWFRIYAKFTGSTSDLLMIGPSGNFSTGVNTGTNTSVGRTFGAVAGVSALMSWAECVHISGVLTGPELTALDNYGIALYGAGAF